MGQVMSSMSMSLDGFVTGPNDSRQHPLGVGGEPLHEWIFSGDSRDSWVLEEMIPQTGAIIMGRRSYDVCEGDGGWGDSGPLGTVPCFVLTHNPPPPERVVAPEVFTFVTGGIEAAVSAAKAAAGDKNVGLHGATALQQCLRAGLVDEIHIHLVPILLGDGVRLFDNEPLGLERTRVVEAPRVTHLRYRVIKEAAR